MFYTLNRFLETIVYDKKIKKHLQQLVLGSACYQIFIFNIDLHTKIFVYFSVNYYFDKNRFALEFQTYVLKTVGILRTVSGLLFK